VRRGRSEVSVPRLRSVPAREEALPDALDALARDGACIVTDLLSPDTCRAMLDDFAPHLDAAGWGEDPFGYGSGFFGERTKRLHGLFSRSPRMGALVAHPFVDRIVRRVLIDSGKAREVRISNAELMVLGSDQPAQELHSDGISWHRAQAYERDRSDSDGEFLLSLNVALTPFTERNGATVVVPGSHRWEAGRAARPEETCRAVMPRGAALLYGGNVLHGGGAHGGGAPRVGLYVGYVVSWLRPLENHLVTNAPEDVRALPAAVQRLLDVVPEGFTVFG
jgi:hypothetical protein